MNKELTTVIEDGNAPISGEKTFSQDDVNRIVSERLGREKTKLESGIAEREQELAQRELLLTAKEQLASRDLPPELLDALNINSPETLESSMKIMDSVIQKIKEERPHGRFKGITPAVGIDCDEDDSVAFGCRTAMGLK